MFVFKGNVIYINASMFGRIIRDPASPPEEVSIKEQNESLQTAFPNNVLISKFNDAAEVNSPSESTLSEERGRSQQSSLAFKGESHNTACSEKSCF